jgi:hypothetical protein
MTKVAVYHIKGDFPQAADLEVVDYMVGEMQERGLLGEPVTIRHFTDPTLLVRDGLNSASIWGDVLMFPEMEGRGRVMPFLDFIAKTGKPIFIPQIPSFPQGIPLNRAGFRELFAYARAQKSKKLAAKLTPGPGGDQGHKPTAESSAKARAAKTVTAEETAIDRAPEVLQAFITHGTFGSAAKHLNKLGHPTPSGTGKWHGSTVRRVLKRAGHVEG